MDASYASPDSEESDDEWFFESIKRYEDLSMYDVQGFVSCATFCDSDRLLLAVSREHLHEVWEVSIPAKLIAGKDAGLTRNRDFSLLTAGYTENLVKEMLYVSSNVVTSGSDGVYLYTIPQPKDDSDVISLTSTLRSDLRDSSLAATDNSIYFGASLSSISSFDLSSHKSCNLKGISNISASTWSSVDVISNMKYVSERLFIGLRDRGNVLLYEPRVGMVMKEIEPPKKFDEKWTMDVNYDGCVVAVASASGDLNVYDLRNVSKAMYVCALDVQEKKNINHKVCISPTDSLLSVSGYDTYVQVFDFKCLEVKGGCIFTHDGHRGSHVQNILTHLWHPSQEKLLFSADNTGKLQGWRFKQLQT